jgi:hypothetical protein
LSDPIRSQPEKDSSPLAMRFSIMHRVARSYPIICGGGVVRPASGEPRCMYGRPSAARPWRPGERRWPWLGPGRADRYIIDPMPHGGMAPGIDRIVMPLAGATNIREVIAFPLNQQAQDLMMNAPSEVFDKQLKELNIRIVPPIKI